jgi:uncharacterized membrane protein YozB (DUF420 family)
MSKPARVVSKEIKMAAVALATIILMATFPIIPMVSLAVAAVLTGQMEIIPVEYELAIMIGAWAMDLYDAAHHDIFMVEAVVFGEYALL